VRAVPRLCELYPGICLTTEEKSTEKTLGGRKVTVGMIHCVRLATLRIARKSCRSRFPCSSGRGSTLGQRRCLPSCLTKGFPTSSYLESNLSEIWYGRRSRGLPNRREFVLPMYQGALVAMQRHLNCGTCSFLVWERDGGPPYRTRIFHHGTDELHIQHNTIPNGETISRAPFGYPDWGFSMIFPQL